ncbi:MAG: hypothetical protein PVJ42_08175 [bacterium]
MRAVAAALVLLLLSAGAAPAGELRLPFSRYRLPHVSQVGEVDEESDKGNQVLIGEEKEEGSDTGKKIAGAVMFGSGVFLCSWGIVDWQFSDAQCCPARNTENVAKIVVGVVLINAGLVYLIAGGL